MSKLQNLGRRLDNTLTLIKKDHPNSENRFNEYVVDKFILLVNSNTNKELEDKIINSLDGWLDMLDMELKGLFEYK